MRWAAAVQADHFAGTPVLNFAWEPSGEFRGYMAEIALQQALRLYSQGVVE